jgi:hypothetical protein
MTWRIYPHLGEICGRGRRNFVVNYQFGALTIEMIRVISLLYHLQSTTTLAAPMVMGVVNGHRVNVDRNRDFLISEDYFHHIKASI